MKLVMKVCHVLDIYLMNFSYTKYVSPILKIDIDSFVYLIEVWEVDFVMKKTMDQNIIYRK